MHAKTLCRQLRYAGYVTRPQNIKITADRQDMLPSRFPINTDMATNVFKARRNKGVTVSHPATTVKKGPRRRGQLDEREQEFVETARKELEADGITDEDRFNAWLTQNHTVFPDKVQDLDPHVKAAVKFGGLGLTREAEEMKEHYFEARREEAKALRDKENAEQQLKALGLQQGVDASNPKHASLIKRKKLTEHQYNKLAARRKEIMSKAKGHVMSNFSDKSMQHWKGVLSTEDSVGRSVESRRMKESKGIGMDLLNARRAAKGESPITVHYPTGGDVDISMKAAVVARCVLTNVPTLGDYPIVIPASLRDAYVAKEREGVNKVLKGLNRNERARLGRSMRRYEAYQSAKAAWNTFKKAEEVGGVGDAKDWKREHPWEWKGSEPKTYTAPDPSDPYGSFRKLQNTEASRDALHTLMTTKQTADMPKNRFTTEFGRYQKRLNSKYGSSHSRWGTDDKVVGRYSGARARITTIKSAD